MANKATPAEKAIAEAAEKALAEEGLNVNAAPAGLNDAIIPPDETPAKRQYKKRGGGETPASNAEALINESVNGPTPASAPAAKPARKSKASQAVTAEKLGNQLVGLHALVAALTGLPEAQLNPAEGEQLGGAILAICEEYDLKVDGKTGAFLQLGAAMAMIYGPRYFGFKFRIAQERQNAANNPQATTVS